MSVQKNIDLKLLKQAILDYRAEGIRLMTELGKKYSLDINNTEDYIKLIQRGGDIPRSGELSKRWNYSFHGGECGFYNKKYQQDVEVVLSNPPKFGYLDPWFVFSYLKSTEKYKSELETLDWQDLELLINLLYETGELEKITK